MKYGKVVAVVASNTLLRPSAMASPCVPAATTIGEGGRPIVEEPTIEEMRLRLESKLAIASEESNDIGLESSIHTSALRNPWMHHFTKYSL